MRPALDLLQEIQRTGDIFFPKNWMDATLSGHHASGAGYRADVSRRAARFPRSLRRIVLQSADTLFRASGSPASRRCWLIRSSHRHLRGKIQGSYSRCPHRPEAQDVALSRPKHGFESRWGRHFIFRINDLGLFSAPSFPSPQWAVAPLCPALRLFCVVARNTDSAGQFGEHGCALIAVDLDEADQALIPQVVQG